MNRQLSAASQNRRGGSFALSSAKAAIMVRARVQREVPLNMLFFQRASAIFALSCNEALPIFESIFLIAKSISLHFAGFGMHYIK